MGVHLHAGRGTVQGGQEERQAGINAVKRFLSQVLAPQIADRI